MWETLFTELSTGIIYRGLKEFIQNIGKRFITTENDFSDAIKQHLNGIYNWSKEINFRDLERSKLVTRQYINLDLEYIPKRLKFQSNVNRFNSIIELIEKKSDHLVILGQPGAGKTTSMKHVCQSLILEDENILGNFNFPIVIRLRELGKYSDVENPIFSFLYNEFKIRINELHKESKERIHSIIEGVVLRFLNDSNSIFILDGYDELPDFSFRSKVIEDLRKLCLNLTNTRVILTSRTADYKFQIENSLEFEIASLSENKIEEFSNNWFESKDKAADFVVQIKKSPFYDTTIRPLTLAHLCAIYDRDGQIPQKPKTVYRNVINLLIEEWNTQKSVIKKSKYSNFEVDRKFEFLSNLSYWLTIEFNKSIFSRDELSKSYEYICKNFDLPKEELNDVIDELESHNGIFLQSGYDTYEFAHKSLQEYLTADYIIRLTEIPTEQNIIVAQPNEFAIAVTLSSDPNKYLYKLITERLDDNSVNDKFFIPFFNRLILESPIFKIDNNLGILVIYLFTMIYNRYRSYADEYYSLVDCLSKFLSLENVRISCEKIFNWSSKKGKHLDEMTIDIRNYNEFHILDDNEFIIRFHSVYKKNIENAKSIEQEQALLEQCVFRQKYFYYPYFIISPEE